MKTILINEQQKEYQGHQVKSVKYHLSSKTAEVHCSVITPEGAWDYAIPDFPYEDPENYEEFVKDFEEHHMYNVINEIIEDESGVHRMVTKAAKNPIVLKTKLKWYQKLLKYFRIK
jgi:hypothetical protein